jgi:hypothetical protein
MSQLSYPGSSLPLKKLKVMPITIVANGRARFSRKRELLTAARL